MRPGGRAALVGVGVGLAAIVAIAAFSGGPQPVACPAVGRIITVDVRISGDPVAVHDVRLCATGGCSAAAARARGSGSPGADAPAPTTPRRASSATPGSGARPTGTASVGDSSGDPDPAFPTGPETPAPVIPTGGPRVAAPVLLLVDEDIPRTWTFSTREEYPTRVSATAYGADGRALAGRVVDLRWRRSAPGDVCDASKVTSPVGLHVGS